MHYYNIKNIPGILISFDFMKAFDMLQWETMYISLKKFGFGEKFIDLVRILYNKPISCVINNGHWSEWFPLSRACRQGCCFSPSIFTICIEMLGIGIRQNKLIEGIRIGNSEVKAGQYADDLWANY